MMSLKAHVPSLLRDIYYNIRNPASFSSIDRVFEEAKKHNLTVRRKDVKDYLQSQFPFTLHHRVVRKFRRNQIIVSSPEELFQADLIDLQSLSKFNDNIKYILTVIDVFSKKAFAFPLKSKSGLEVKAALQKLFSSGKIPEKLQTDSGKEFLNFHVQNLLKQHHVMYMTAKNETIKCAFVERFQRTLQTKLYKYLTGTGGSRYIDVLQDAVESYNNSVHSATGMRPNEVSHVNRDVVFRNLYGVDNLRTLVKQESKIRPRLKVGDVVRLVRKKDSFRKGYIQTFSDEIYTIIKVSRPPGINTLPLYKLQNVASKRVLRRRFYFQEIVKVADSVKNYYRGKPIGEERRGVYGYG